jgi:cell wall-associated NlpC family hydrolase
MIDRERAAVVAEARRFLGTPFHHAARLCGVGVDCIQLVIAAYVTAGVITEPAIGAYPRDWFLHQARERILEAIGVSCVEAPPSDTPGLGDIALFRFGRAVSHAAIVVTAAPEVLVVHSFRAIGVIEESVSAHSTLGARLAGYWMPRRWHVTEAV